jgi:hypothetical protein
MLAEDHQDLSQSHGTGWPNSGAALNFGLDAGGTEKQNDGMSYGMHFKEQGTRNV